MGELLDRLDLPKDLKGLPMEILIALAAEIREAIIDIVPRTGGHLGTNLGVVELSVALHSLYDFPEDKLVLDVGHNSYPHKILTGRLKRFSTLRKKNGLCGYPNPWESEHDHFLTGHAGTSISTALGISSGYAAQQKKNKVVAVIGDGSLCGLAFEGLNQAGHLKKDMLIILNDNKMAISPTVGGLSKYLSRVRSEETYHNLLKDIKTGLHSLPLVGETLESIGESVMGSLRQSLLPDQIFTAMGLSYYGPIDGHNLEELIPMIKNLRESKGPLLLHVLTEKGKGFKGAESHPYKVHTPPSAPSQTPAPPSWSQVFSNMLIKEAVGNKKIHAITAAMAQGTALEEFIEKYPGRSIDTGIAEAHAVTMAGGMEFTGVKPVVLIYSTFLQRAYDSLMHDICLQKSAAVIFALDRAGLSGEDGASHHGLYDVAYLRNLPRMNIIAPRDEEELKMMFSWALKCTEPVAIRYPKGRVPKFIESDNRPEIESGCPELMVRGTKVLLIGYGATVEFARSAMESLKEKGIEPGLLNLRFVKPINSEALLKSIEGYKYIISIEDHALMGGVGSALLEVLNDRDVETSNFYRLGVPDRFVSFASRPEQLAEVGIDAASIEKKVLEILANE